MAKMVLKQALRPQRGKKVTSKYMHALAEAINSRILSGAGDAHWRIPYYIFSAYFRKPRLDDGTLYTAENEFFDYYQSINPETEDLWPVQPPQMAQGANLQTNNLNKFIFGMNYVVKDDDGYWVFEREDVRVRQAQLNLQSSPTNFRGVVFPFFNRVSATSAGGEQYTAFGLAKEYLAPGYINSNTINPSGHSYGGYYGTIPEIKKVAGCGFSNFADFPQSEATFYRVGLPLSEKYTINDLCPQGVGEFHAPKEYSSLLFLSDHYAHLKISGGQERVEHFLDKTKYHLKQFNSNVFLGRETKNHLYRLLYNYITYARNFDFDWFFTHQYAYAPEIGSFASATAYFDEYENFLGLDDININPEKIDFKLNSVTNSTYAYLNIQGNTATTFQTGCQLNRKRLSYGYKLNSLNSDFLTVGQQYKVVDGSILHASSIYSKGQIFTGQGDVYTILEEPGLVAEYIPNQADLTPVTNVSEIKNLLYRYGLLSSSPQEIPNNLFYYRSNALDIPVGFTLHSFSINTQNLKSFTIIIEVYSKNNNSYTENNLLVSKEIYFKDSEAEKLTSRVLEGFLAGDYSVKFRIKDCILIDDNLPASVSSLTPIFLFSYKPKVEDAYAMIRACTYWGDSSDAKIDDPNHPLNSANIFSNDLKTIGFINFANIKPLQGNEPDRTSPHLNNNAFFETARRLSSYVRIIGGDQYAGAGNPTPTNPEGGYIPGLVDNTLKFKRYARNGYYENGKSTKYQIYYNKSITEKLPFDKSVSSSLRTLSQSQNAIVLPNGFEMNFSSNYETGYIGFIKDSLDSSEAGKLNDTTEREYLTDYYTSVKLYDFTKDNISFTDKLDFELIRTYNKSGETPLFSNKIDFSFSTTALYFDYDALIVNPNNTNYFIYIRFEDKFGDPINNSSTEKSYKKYIVNNKVYVSGSTPITGDLASVTESDLISISLNGQTPVNPYIYVFSRTLNSERLQQELGNSIKGFGNKGFFASQKDGSLISMEVKKLSDDDNRKKPFYSRNLLSIPVNLNSWIETTQEPEDDQKIKLIHKLDLSSAFRGNNSNSLENDIPFPLVGIDSMYNQTNACSIVSETVSNDPNTSPNEYKEIIFRLFPNDNTEVDLIKLYNLLYLNYAKFGIDSEFDQITGLISWVYNSSNPLDFQEKTVYFYNNNLAGCQVKFFNHETGTDTMDEYQGHFKRIKIDRKFEMQVFDSSNNGRGTATFFELENFVSLPTIVESTDYIKVKIPINIYKDLPRFNEVAVTGTSLIANTQYYVVGGIISFGGNQYGTIEGDKVYFQTEASPGNYTVISGSPSLVQLVRLNDIYYNFNVFLAVNYYSFLDDFLSYSSSVNRNGSLYIERTLTTFDKDSNISKSLLRDLFAGIALDPDNPENAGKNGIISDPESGFSNEWALWINFLPFTDQTTPFKKEVYALSGSPFYDRCHINSSLIPKSTENLHLNLGLDLARYVEAPPSYRYMPLLVKGSILYENSRGTAIYDKDEQAKKIAFYTSCSSTGAVYKIKSVTFREGEEDFVYVELSRPLDIGFSTSEMNYSYYRSDSNGLYAWNYANNLMEVGGNATVNFAIGDAAFTNQNGVNQITSANSNQYKGSYYPRFFFVKLIPKPKIDNNSEYDANDAPLSHEPLKQAELYLNAMREGFTGSDLNFPQANCTRLKGHITPPDYTYEQLIHESNSYVDSQGRITAGNMWPPLITFSPAYNTFDPQNLLLGPLRFEDNPRGFGAIPQVKTYGEYFDCLVNSVNRLTSFRVGFPQTFIGQSILCRNAEYQNGNENNWYIPANNGDFSQGQFLRPSGFKGYFAKFNSPSIVNPGNCVVSTFNLKNYDGEIRNLTSFMGYSIQGPDRVGFTISDAYILTEKQTSSVALKPLDPDLLKYSFTDIKDYIKETDKFPFYYNTDITGTQLKLANYVTPDGCGSFFKNAANQYFINERVFGGSSKCRIGNNAIFIPPPLFSGTPYFNIVVPRPCRTGDIDWQDEGTVGSVPYSLRSFNSSSSVSVTVLETGWRIITPEIQAANVNEND